MLWVCLHKVNKWTSAKKQQGMFKKIKTIPRVVKMLENMQKMLENMQKC